MLDITPGYYVNRVCLTSWQHTHDNQHIFGCVADGGLLIFLPSMIGGGGTTTLSLISSMLTTCDERRSTLDTPKEEGGIHHLLRYCSYDTPLQIEYT